MSPSNSEWQIGITLLLEKTSYFNSLFPFCFPFFSFSFSLFIFIHSLLIFTLHLFFLLKTMCSSQSDCSCNSRNYVLGERTSSYLGKKTNVDGIFVSCRMQFFFSMRQDMFGNVRKILMVLYYIIWHIMTQETVRLGTYITFHGLHVFCSWFCSSALSLVVAQHVSNRLKNLSWSKSIVGWAVALGLIVTLLPWLFLLRLIEALCVYLNYS